MASRAFTIGVFLVLAVIAVLSFGHRTSSAQGSALAPQIAQGKYLASAVAGCTDCHGANLHGAPLPFGPIVKMPPGMHWAKFAPNIVALIHTGSASKWARFLETGVDPNGGHADPPMPQFRMKPSDAQAVITYVRSLH